MFDFGGSTDHLDKAILIKRSEIENLDQELSKIDVHQQSSAVSVAGSKAIRKVKSRYDRDLDQLESGIRKKRIQIAEIVSLNQKDIESAVAMIEIEINHAVAKFNMQEEVNLGDRDTKLKQYKEYEKVLGVINKDVEALEEKRTDVRNTINSKVENTQIYRMAMWWSGNESAADVQKSTVAYFPPSS